MDQAMDQRMDTQGGWQNCVCSRILVVGWPGAKARADVGACQRTFLLMPRKLVPNITRLREFLSISNLGMFLS